MRVFVAMIFCHTAYFKLVSLLPAHVAAISVLAVPAVGVISSAWLLGEPVGLAEAAALLLVVGGLFLLLRRRPGAEPQRPRRAPRASRKTPNRVLVTR